MRIKRVGFAFLAMCLSIPVFAPAHAAERFPDREIRIIIGFPPGSSTELSLRALAQVASKYIDKPLVILNKPGGSQAIAHSELANAKPDGYTIGVATDGFRSLTRYQMPLTFDPDRITTLVGYARFRHVLFVNGESPYANYDDYIAFGRSGADKLSYGGSGEGTAPDLLGKLLFREVGVKAVFVPFKGTNELVPAVIGKHLISGINDVSLLLPYFKSGQLKPVLVFGDERIEGLDVTTSKEKGLSDDLTLFNSVISVVVPRGTPPDRVKVLYDVFRKAAQDPEFKKLADTLGLQAKFFEPAEVEARIQRLQKTGVPLLKQLGFVRNESGSIASGAQKQQ